jgi:hypothetical protein
MLRVWQGPPLERARISLHEPITYYAFLRQDAVWGKVIAQVYGHSPEEVNRRARVVRLALEEATT